MSEKNSKHAIIIGGSLSGLLAARVLSDHFDHVTIVERDPIPETPEPRKSVPQGNHVHVVFGGGLKVINRLYPGFFDDIEKAGSTKCDFSRDLCWYHMGVWKARPKSDLTTYWQSRPFLEAHVRERTRQNGKVSFLEECNVERLIASADNSRVTGIEVQHRTGDKTTEQLEADLVIDASGRGSQMPKWLESLGYQRPEEKSVQVNIGYASRIFEPSEDPDRDWKILAVFGTPPHGTRSGYIFPIEGGRWLASEVGFLKDYPPGEDFVEYSRGMDVPDYYEAIKDAKPLTPVSTFKYPASQWRRYDRLSTFPAGLLVTGDAISSFNPVYGQGMSVCALEVDQLQQMLQHHTGTNPLPDDFARQFFRKTAKIIEVPWLLASQSDFLYPDAIGTRPLKTGPLNWYLRRMLQLCSGNDRVVKTFYDVLHFVRKPTAFFHPSIFFSVMGRALGLKNSYRPSQERPQLSE